MPGGINAAPHDHTEQADAGRAGFIQTGGEHVRYRVGGDGAPLLMIYGIGAPL